MTFSTARDVYTGDGVDLLICDECGAVVAGDDGMEQHHEWHRSVLEAIERGTVL